MDGQGNDGGDEVVEVESEDREADDAVHVESFDLNSFRKVPEFVTSNRTDADCDSEHNTACTKPSPWAWQAAESRAWKFIAGGLAD